MKRTSLLLAVVVVSLASPAGRALATPTKQIWIPSTDVQEYLTPRLTLENYFRATGDHDATPTPDAPRDTNTFDLGITVGVLPFQKVKMELGLDYMTNANDPNDQHPWSGNIKLATPEDSLFPYSPAAAFGLYNARPVKDVSAIDAPKVYSGQNIVYFLLARTAPTLGPLPSLGRFSAGYYRGCRRALIDNPDPSVARRENSGLLLSWDRRLQELSHNLWVGIDYLEGRNLDGAVSVGISWTVFRQLDLLFGYNVYTAKDQAGSNTFTTQVRLSLP